MENPLKSLAPKLSASVPQSGERVGGGRLPAIRPVAIIDIGSNSVRLVAYEGRTRSPATLFNEKVLCGLGRGVASTGKMEKSAVASALAALKRFRGLCDVMQIDDVHILATAAVRDASNGDVFLKNAGEILRQPVSLLPGAREAELSALGVISGFWKPDGVVGDMGGGSLELVEILNGGLRPGLSLQLGGFALQDASGASLKKAATLARAALANAPQIGALKGRTFYAVGGTWRALARLHMEQIGYPLHVMHAYSITPRDAIEFSRMVQRLDVGALEAIGSISSARRPLLAYGALLLEQIVRRGHPSSIMISPSGVREGFLYEDLEPELQARDPLLVMASEMNWLRSRSPRHCEELVTWVGALLASLHLTETPAEARVRAAACLVSDICWRAHPDYRGDQAVMLLSQAAFSGITHPERGFIALANFIRHEGMSSDSSMARIRELMPLHQVQRARILGASMRVAYILSAAMAGVLPRCPLTVKKGVLTLVIPAELENLRSDRIANRLRQLGRTIGMPTQIV